MGSGPVPDDAGDGRFGGPEDLHRDPLRRDAARRESGGELVHEPGRAADVVVRVARDLRALDRLDGDPPGTVKAGAEFVVGAGTAVGGDPVAVCQLREQSVDLLPEGVLLAVARSVDPPHLTRGVMVCERAEHR